MLFGDFRDWLQTQRVILKQKLTINDGHNLERLHAINVVFDLIETELRGLEHDVLEATAGNASTYVTKCCCR
jgi:hypothetical protein